MRKIIAIGLILILIAGGVFAMASQDNSQPSTPSPRSTSSSVGTMISYWRFDEGSGLLASDSVGANDGTLMNGPVWTTGMVNNALSFDGTDDHVDVPEDATLNLTTPLSLEAWIRPSVFPTHGSDYKNVINRRPNSGGYQVELLYSGTTNGRIGFFIDDGTNFDYLPVTSPNIALNSWAHIVTTLESNVMKLYINGTLAGTKSTTVTPSTNSEPLLIGTSHQYNCYFNGKIDEVAIYGKALNQSEIQEHYNNSVNGEGYIETNPEEAIEDLIDDIENMNLHHGLENSLVKKLENALKSLENGNDGAAINQLNAFINEVEAQRGNKLTNEQADELIAAAEAIIASIGT